jgi:glucan phosphorylase
MRKATPSPDAAGTPRGRPNGGLNLSELDGWWAEAYTPEVGWAWGDGCEHGDDPAWDAAEAEALYGLLEREVVWCRPSTPAMRKGSPEHGWRRCGRA